MGFFSDIVSTVSHVVSDIAEPAMAVASPLTFFGTSVASGALKGITPELSSMASEVMGAVQPFAALLGSFANLNLGGDVRIGGAKNINANSSNSASPSALQGISTSYTGILDSLDQKEQSLTSQLNNPSLTPSQLLSLQDQITKVNLMFQLIAQIVGEDARTKEAIIQHV